VVRADAGGFRAGDRVAAMAIIGGFAETVAVDAHRVFPLPDGVPFDKAAALPLNYLTVHFALVRRARCAVRVQRRAQRPELVLLETGVCSPRSSWGGDLGCDGDGDEAGAAEARAAAPPASAAVVPRPSGRPGVPRGRLLRLSRSVREDGRVPSGAGDR
jgi:hypothetical protein